MTGPDDFTVRNAQLLGLFEKHLGVKAASLETAVARAGRRLPKTLRRKAAVLVAAEASAGHPKLIQQLDMPSLNTAFRDLRDHLQKADLKAQRRTRQLNTLAAVVFNLLLVLTAFLVWVWWQGQP